jgi:diguanylate cyclase (GGDEF)-like protein
MLTKVRQLLAPPVFADDEDKTRLAGLLNTIGWIWLAGTALFIIAFVIVEPQLAPRLWLALPAFPVLVGVLLLARRGRIRLASGLLVTGTWLVLVLAALGSGGVRAPSFAGCVIIVLAAGIFLGRRAALGFAGLSILAGLAMVAADRLGLLPSMPLALTAFATWLSDAVFFIVAAILLHLATYTITEALGRARAEVAARKQAEAGLRESVERLAALYEIDQAILTTQSIEVIAQAAVSRIQRLVPCWRAAVYRFDFASGQAVPLAAAEAGEPVGVGPSLPLDDFGISGFLLSAEQVYVTDDLLGVSGPCPFEAQLRAAGLRSRLEAPLTLGAELMGSLGLTSRVPHAFQTAQIDIAGQVADQLAVAIQQAQLVAEIRRHSEELERRVAERTAQLATANQDLGGEITQRRRVQDELKATNTRLTTWLEVLEARTHEMALLNEMVALFQTCQTSAEAYSVIAKMAPNLFPGDAGALAIIHPSRNMVETMATWGEPDYMVNVFQMDDCWALRRARPHLVQEGRDGLTCRHLTHTPPAYVCVPLFAHGEVLGCLHLNTAAGQLSDPTQQLAKTVADAIALSLANLRLRETLRQQSIIDALTGLFNRRYLEETLERELRRAARAKGGLGIIMADIDHFKDFNDRFGHAAGDIVLVELGRLLRSHIRAEDIACRYGGEEFVLILPDSTLAVTAERAQRLSEHTRALRVEFGGQVIGPVSLSLGVAAFPEHGVAGGAVLSAADEALYAAKGQGRDRVAVAALPTGSEAPADAT